MARFSQLDPRVDADRVTHQIADQFRGPRRQFRGPRRRRYHGTWVGPEPHPEHQHVPGLGISPGAELIAPCRVVLRTAQAFRLIGRIGGGDRTVGPRQPALTGLVKWALRIARLRDAQLALAHANRVTVTGQLAASITHEVSQPIAATLTNANAARRWLDAEPPDLEEVREAIARIIRDGGRAGCRIGTGADPGIIPLVVRTDWKRINIIIGYWLHMKEFPQTWLPECLSQSANVLRTNTGRR